MMDNAHVRWFVDVGASLLFVLAVLAIPVLVVLLPAGERARLEAERVQRISACHARGGTVRLNAGDGYAGCDIPPGAKP